MITALLANLVACGMLGAVAGQDWADAWRRDLEPTLSSAEGAHNHDQDFGWTKVRMHTHKPGLEHNAELLDKDDNPLRFAPMATVTNYYYSISPTLTVNSISNAEMESSILSDLESIFEMYHATTVYDLDQSSWQARTTTPAITAPITLSTIVVHSSLDSNRLGELGSHLDASIIASLYSTHTEYIYQATIAPTMPSIDRMPSSPPLCVFTQSPSWNIDQNLAGLIFEKMSTTTYTKVTGAQVPTALVHFCGHNSYPTFAVNSTLNSGQISGIEHRVSSKISLTLYSTYTSGVNTSYYYSVTPAVPDVECTTSVYTSFCTAPTTLSRWSPTTSFVNSPTRSHSVKSTVNRLETSYVDELDLDKLKCPFLKVNGSPQHQSGASGKFGRRLTAKKKAKAYKDDNSFSEGEDSCSDDEPITKIKSQTKKEEQATKACNYEASFVSKLAQYMPASIKTVLSTVTEKQQRTQISVVPILTTRVRILTETQYISQTITQTAVMYAPYTIPVTSLETMYMMKPTDVGCGCGCSGNCNLNPDGMVLSGNQLPPGIFAQPLDKVDRSRYDIIGLAGKRPRDPAVLFSLNKSLASAYRHFVGDVSASRIPERNQLMVMDATTSINISWPNDIYHGSVSLQRIPSGVVVMGPASTMTIGWPPLTRSGNEVWHGSATRTLDWRW